MLVCEVTVCFRNRLKTERNRGKTRIKNIRKVEKQDLEGLSGNLGRIKEDNKIGFTVLHRYF